jgi:hypothetical protein
MNKIDAIYATYPQVTVIRGDDAYDANGDLVTINEATLQVYINTHSYIEKRRMEYPPITDYLDGVVKGNQTQIDAYIAACQAVKTKYPKPE